MDAKTRREAISKLQTILDHFTDQAEREVWQSWNLDAKGRHVPSKVVEASPPSFWHDSAVHEAMQGNDPSCEVIKCAMWVMDALNAEDAPVDEAPVEGKVRKSTAKVDAVYQA